MTTPGRQAAIEAAANGALDHYFHRRAKHLLQDRTLEAGMQRLHRVLAEQPGADDPYLIERYYEMNDLFGRCADLLHAIKAIVDEPLDERAGQGPSRAGQFARIEALVRDLPKLPALAEQPAALTTERHRREVAEGERDEARAEIRRLQQAALRSASRHGDRSLSRYEAEDGKARWKCCCECGWASTGYMGREDAEAAWGRHSDAALAASQEET